MSIRRPHRALLVVLPLVAACLALPSSASAESIVVNSRADSDDGTCTTDPEGCTLREAINHANDNGPTDPDQITFSVTGAIGLSSQLPEITTRTTITGPGAGALTVYRQSGIFRIFTLNGSGAAETIRIEGLTIDNGDAGSLNGGGVYVDVGGLNFLDEVVVTRSKAANGGGVFVGSGASLDVIRSTISGNTANGAPQGHGGGIRNDGELLIDRSTVANNTATTGGGGGVWSGDTPNDSAVIFNSTIAGNNATAFGGGLQASNGSLSLLSDTIVGNRSDSDDSGSEPGGGVMIVPSGADVANTILAGNVRGTGTPVASQCRLGSGVGTTLDSGGYNLRSSADDGPGPEACAPNFNQPGDSINPAPMLGPLANNGGPTPTIALLPGSPAINAGNPLPPANMAYPACRATDQRGLPRGGVNGVCDIGALEVQPTAPTTPTTPTSPAPPAPAGKAFDLAAALKKCKKQKRRLQRRGKPWKKKFKKCRRKARRRAGLV